VGTGGTTGSGGVGAGGTGGSVATGSGGATGAGGSVVVGDGGLGVSKCDGAGTRILALTQAKVDDFEGALLNPGWSSFNDVLPTPDVFKLVQQVGDAIRLPASTGHSGHYTGMGARVPPLGYGVGTIFNVAVDRVAGVYCIDVGSFDGVTFWARAAVANSRVLLNFVVPATNGPPAPGLVSDGDCVTGCFNHPLRAITLTTTWAQYSVTFAEAVGSTGTRVTLNRIQGLLWISQDVNWDFSLDEIQFYKGIPPTGVVGP
jgi:hypothetical protein